MCLRNMKIFLLPFISIFMSILYYSPWTLGATRANLGPYLLALLWFAGAWIIAVFYMVNAFKYRKINTLLSKRYLMGLTLLLTSYVIVGVGIFNGYVVTV